MQALNYKKKDFKFLEPFSGLFTQGMVCHETYKDSNGQWLYPEEIEKISKNEVIKKLDSSKVIVGASESMSKSKKNTIDPETMIKQYGADSVRWFILSDSPPEKDVQWSDAGVASSNKFLQKIWNLNQVVLNRKIKVKNNAVTDNFINKVDQYVFKIDKAINNFHLNVAIAQFYEIYKYFNEALSLEIDNQILTKNLIKLMKLMMPFTPHLASECLSNLKCKEVNKWPIVNKRSIENANINMVIQVNGRTRDVINVERDLTESDLEKLIKKDSKAKKYIIDKKIVKTIFIKNKIINYIVKN